MRIGLLLVDGRAEIVGHVADAGCHARHAIRLVLKIPQDLREVDGPLLQLFVVAHRNAQHFGGDYSGHRRGRIGHDIGGSRKSIWRPITSTIGFIAPRPMLSIFSAVSVRSAEKRLRTVTTSAYRVTIQACMKGSQCTGSASRSSRYKPYGDAITSGSMSWYKLISA